MENKKSTKKYSKPIVKFVAVDNVQKVEFVENQQGGYVNFGEYNQLPYLLKDLYGSVSVHKGIIKKKINMIKGNGIIIDEKCKNFKQTLEFMANINDTQTFDDIFDRVVADYVTYGGSYLQIVWNRKGDKINKIIHMPFESIRAEIADNEGNVNNYYYNPSRDKINRWKKYTTASKLHKFPAFGSENKKEPQIYYIKDYDVSSFYYSLPDYSGAITDLDTFRSISEFHNSNIHNGLQPSFIIAFKGTKPSPEAQNEIVKQIQNKYTDIENAGKPLIFFLDNEEEPVIKVVEKSEVDTMFNELYNNTLDNIIISHQIPRILANVKTEGSLGGSKEYIEAEYIFNKNYVKPVQKLLLDKLNILFNINDLCNVDIQNPKIDINRYSIDELLKLFSEQEVVDLLGLK